MASVLSNQSLLQKIIEEEEEEEEGGGKREKGEGEGEEGEGEGRIGEGEENEEKKEEKRKYGVEKFVGEVVTEVYEVVDGLREEIEFMLEKKWKGIRNKMGWGEEGEGGKEGEVMKRDYEYLVKMKEMDEKIKREQIEGKREKRGLELSTVVPVAGLVMARFHVYNCEINTAIEHWEMVEGKKEREMRRESEEGEGERREEGRTGREVGVDWGVEWGVEWGDEVQRERRENSVMWAGVWEGCITKCDRGAWD